MEPFKDLNYLRGKRLSRFPGQKANQDEVRGNEHLGRPKRTEVNKPENVNFYTRMLQGSLPTVSDTLRQRRRITLEPDLSIFHNRSQVNPGLFRNSKIAFDHHNKRSKVRSTWKCPTIPEASFSNVKNSCFVELGGGEPCDPLIDSEQSSDPFTVSKLSLPAKESFDFCPSSPPKDSTVYRRCSTQSTLHRNIDQNTKPKTIIEHYVSSGDSLNNHLQTSDYNDDFSLDLSDSFPLLPKQASTLRKSSRLPSPPSMELSLENCPLSPIPQKHSTFVDLPYSCRNRRSY